VTSPIKILFDECLSQPAVKQISDFESFGGAMVEIAHVLDRFPRGTLDRDWIPQIASESWLVVSADRGRGSAKGGKLPFLCRELLVTHLVLGSGFNKRSMHFKMQEIVAKFERIAAICQAPRGSGFSISLSGESATQIKQIWTPPDPQEMPTVQQNLPGV
jgi:hypothetical protein